MRTTVVNLHREPFEVYIGRAGRGHDGYFGNPVRVGGTCPICGKVHADGGSTLPCFKRYFWRRLHQDPEFYRRVSELEGKTLGCFCEPPEGFQDRLLCHGQIIKAWLDAGKPM